MVTAASGDMMALYSFIWGLCLLNNFGFFFSWICKVVCKKQENEIANQSQIPDPSRAPARAH